MIYFTHLFVHLYVMDLVNARKMEYIKILYIYILKYYSPSKIQMICNGSHAL
jgi:hypothetical protein